MQFIWQPHRLDDWCKLILYYNIVCIVNMSLITFTMPCTHTQHPCTAQLARRSRTQSHPSWTWGIPGTWYCCYSFMKQIIGSEIHFFAVLSDSAAKLSELFLAIGAFSFSCFQWQKKFWLFWYMHLINNLTLKSFEKNQIKNGNLRDSCSIWWTTWH